MMSRDIPFHPDREWRPDIAEVSQWRAYEAWRRNIMIPAPRGLPFQLPGDEWLAATIVCGVASLDLVEALAQSEQSDYYWPEPETCATCGHGWCEGFTALVLTSVELADRLDGPERDTEWGTRVGELAVARGEAVRKLGMVPPFLLKWVETWNDEMRQGLNELAELVEPKVGRPRKSDLASA